MFRGRVQDYWLPTAFACFPFTSPTMRHRVPSGFNWALPLTGVNRHRLASDTDSARNNKWHRNYLKNPLSKIPPEKLTVITSRNSSRLTESWRCGSTSWDSPTARSSKLLYFNEDTTYLGTAVAQWWRCCATNRKVAGSVPAGVSGFFIDIKSFRSHYSPGVDSASNRNEYQEYFLGGKNGHCVKLTTYHHPVPLSRNLGTLTSWNPLSPSGPVTGLLYLFTDTWIYCATIL